MTNRSTDPDNRLGALEPGQLYLSAWVFYLVIGLGGLLWLGWQHGRLGLELFVDPSTLVIDLGLGVAGGGVLLGFWEAMRRLLPRAIELERELGKLLGGVRRDEAVALAILSGVAEEIFFRGAVQSAWGLAVATLLFALLHSGPGRAFRLWTLFAGFAGLLLGALAWWRGPLLTPIVAHAVVNGVNLARLASEPERGPSAEGR